jgi:hypothetical protein
MLHKTEIKLIVLIAYQFFIEEPNPFEHLATVDPAETPCRPALRNQDYASSPRRHEIYCGGRVHSLVACESVQKVLLLNRLSWGGRSLREGICDF